MGRTDNVTCPAGLCGLAGGVRDHRGRAVPPLSTDAVSEIVQRQADKAGLDPAAAFYKLIERGALVGSFGLVAGRPLGALTIGSGVAPDGGQGVLERQCGPRPDAVLGVPGERRAGLGMAARMMAARLKRREAVRRKMESLALCSEIATVS